MRWLGWAFLLLLVACQGSHEPLDPRIDNRVRWTSLAVSSEAGQADAHLLQFPKDYVVLIDAGEAIVGDLAQKLLKQKVDHIDKLYISHGHRDHYQGIDGLFKKKISIGEIYLNMPSKAACDTEFTWGCDWENLNNLVKSITDKGIPLKTMAEGDILYQSNEITLKVLYAYTSDKNPYGVDKIGINDMSVIMRLDNGTSSALFTGDLDMAVGTYLAEHGTGLEVDVLKVPHHGADSVAPNAFLEKINPSAAIITAPRTLWDGSRNTRVRSWLNAKNIPTYVNGLRGSVSVRMYPTDWKFE